MSKRYTKDAYGFHWEQRPTVNSKKKSETKKESAYRMIERLISRIHSLSDTRDTEAKAEALEYEVPDELYRILEQLVKEEIEGSNE